MSVITIGVSALVAGITTKIIATYTYCERYGNTGHYAEVEEVPVCIRHQKNLET